jgi:ABC-type microcin C transport system permease subunit YejB
MFGYLLKRLLIAIPTLLAISAVIFFHPGPFTRQSAGRFSNQSGHYSGSQGKYPSFFRIRSADLYSLRQMDPVSYER